MKTGFSLVGTLIAVGILGTASILVARILTRSEEVAGLARERFVATQIAREGLELVRALRDNNWFSEDATGWTQGLCEGDSTREFTLDVAMVRNLDGVGDIEESALWIREEGAESEGEWTHTPTDVATAYSRELAVDCSQQEADPAFIEVTSRVSWESRGKEQEVLVKERLYDWLPTEG